MTHVPETRELLLLRAFFDPALSAAAGALVSPEQMRTDGTLFMAQALCGMSRSGMLITPDTVSLYLQTDFGDTQQEAEARVAAIMAEDPPAVDSFNALVRQVAVDADRAARKKLAEWLVADGARVQADDALARINEYVRTSAMVRPDDFRSMKAGVRELLSGPAPDRPITLGFGKLDEVYQIFPGSFNVVLADSGVGKSSVMMNASLNIARQGVNVYIFSIEMQQRNLNARAIGIAAGLSIKRLLNKDLTPQEQEHAEHHEREYSTVFSRVFLTDPDGLSAEAVHGMILKTVAKHGPGVVFIDYLGLLTASGRHINNETSMQAQVSKTLMLAAKSTNTPIIALSQVTVANSGMELIKGSKQPKNDAWTILLLERDDEEDSSDQVVLRARVLKNRNGVARGKFNLAYNLPTQRIYYSDELN